ncbi:MAG TPA: PQQ-binding-like beta-propeller repeat protein [Chloroflexota bacterium]|nr:PQQ-binding-like beta-propeller repeat protein [Chloroflexota bacterium]
MRQNLRTERAARHPSSPIYLPVAIFFVLLLGSVVGIGLTAHGALPRPAFASSSDDWPTLGHDSRRSGSTAVGPTGPYTKEWYRDFWSESGEQVANGYQPPIVHDAAHGLDLTYVGVANGALYALNLANGATFWRFPASGYVGGILSSPTIVNGNVYVASLDGKVYSLDGTNVSAGTPAPRWTFTSGRQGGFWGSPVVTPTGVYIGGRDGYFYALDPTTGAKLWEYYVGAPILTSPAYDNGVVYFGAEDLRAYALNATSGALIWKSGQLAGQTMRNGYPVVTNSLVIFRTTPADDPNKILPEGEQVLAFAAGCSTYPAQASYDRSNAPCFNWKAAASSQADYDRESQAVVSYLSGAGYGGIPGRPQYETFFALRKADGQKAFTAPVLWTAWGGNPGVPPVVDQNDNLWVLYRSYYSDYDEPSWYIMTAFGQMNQTTGAITIHNPNPHPTGYSCDSYSCDPPFVTNIWMIGDETTAFSVAGNQLYTNQWSGLGSIDLSNGNLQSVIGKRDDFAAALTSGAPRSLTFGAVPPSLDEAVGPSIYRDTLVVTYSSVVAGVKGHLLGTTPTPQPTSTPRPIATFTATTAGPVAIPSQTNLEHYVWEVPIPINVDQTRSADLVASLNSAVSNFLSSGRLAPWIFIPGKSAIHGYFLDPAQTEYALGLAYPYLTPSLQKQVKSFVNTEQSGLNPLTDRYVWNDGLTYRNGQVIENPARQRLPFAPGPYDYCQIQGCEGVGPQTGWITVRQPFERLYDLWAYAYWTGDWSWIQANWPAIKATRSIVDTSTDSGLLGLNTNPAGTGRTWNDSANRRLAALIAYTRMAYFMQDTAETSWGVNAATLAMQARLRYVNNFRPVDGNGADPATANWTTDALKVASGGMFIQRFGAMTTNIPQYRELSPEVGRLLSDYAGGDFARYDAYMNVVHPTLYLQRGPNNLDGEVLETFPHDVEGDFLAKALVRYLGGDQLRQYLDVPWTQEDLFYWERLARTINSYGIRAAVDLRHPGQPPIILGYQSTLSVTK